MTLYCQDCGTGFEFTDKDKKFYEEHNYILPKRCRACRNAKTLRTSLHTTTTPIPNLNTKEVI